MAKRAGPRIRILAEDRCEYCRIPDRAIGFRHVFDHIVARQHGGRSVFANLAFCCGDRNRHKDPNIAGLGPDTGTLVPLFNPRRDVWIDHFRWDDAILLGTTPIGRATVSVLAINQPIRVAARRALRDEGL
jgi:hypothetical protein